MSPIDTAIIFVYLAMMVALGLYANRQQDNVEDHFVASGKIGTLSIACLWLAGWVCGAAVIAGASNAYRFGISAGWYIGSMAMGCLLVSFLVFTVMHRGDQATP